MKPLDYLQTLCIEAAELFGNDWPSINQHVSERLDELGKSERDALRSEIGRILDFQPPANEAARRLQ